MTPVLTAREKKGLTLLSVPQMLLCALLALAGCGGTSHCMLPLGFLAAGSGTGVLMAAVRAS